MIPAQASLLDVNVLIALGVRQHNFHFRASSWVRSGRFSSLFTCAITELGFVRIVAQTPPYGLNVIQAKTLLDSIKNWPSLPMTLLHDDQSVSNLPAWVKAAGQTTDGHLLQLASAHGAILATFDARIPGAFLIP